MTQRNVSFPSDFMWGTATSAYQTEGGGANTDWWRFELAVGSTATEPSGDACDSWHRYEEDLDLVQNLGLNAYRFSIEWARVEPERGTFSHEALAHYRDMIESCRRRSILAVVTLHHFTLPLWVSDAGGFESPDIATWMGDYAAVVAASLGDVIDVACTINEPNALALLGYLMGLFPPAVEDWDRFVGVNHNLRACHATMSAALRAGPGNFPIGFTLSMQEWEAAEGGEALVDMIRGEMEDQYLRSVEGDDFMGVQCYTKIQLGPEGPIPPSGETTEMGYLYWPQCVEYTLRRAAAATDVPLVMSENGIGTNDDVQRIRYLTEALRGLRNVRDDGIDVRGYFQWSLLDNFEWAHGYGPKFGIVAVDRVTFERTAKPSAQWYSEAVRYFPASIS